MRKGENLIREKNEGLYVGMKGKKKENNKTATDSKDKDRKIKQRDKH